MLKRIYICTDEQRKNLSISHIGLKQLPETIAKRIATRKRNNAIWHTPETKRKIGLANANPKIEIICQVCSKKLFAKYPKRKYCSHQCYWKNIKTKTNKLKGRKLYHLRGENSNHWKGGITSLYETIRRLEENINWRKSVFEQDNYTCQECGATGCRLNAHHKKEFSVIFKEFLQQYSQFSPIEDKETLVRLAITYASFWELSNGTTLCRECHLLIPNCGQFKVRKNNGMR